MSADSDDKKHDATAKRLAELRKKGTVLRSRDLTSGMIFIVGVSVIVYMSLQFNIQIRNNFTQSFGLINQVVDNHDFVFIFLRKLVISNFMLIFPVLAGVFVLAFFSPVIFGGWNFTLESIHFNLEKLNPITNLKNIYSPGRMLTEIFKSVVKAVFLLGVLAIFFVVNHQDIFSLGNYPIKGAISKSYDLAYSFMELLMLSLVFLVGLDLVIQYFQYQNKVKMTTQEIKDEYKEAEGNSDVKRKMRSAQFQLLKQRINMSVPKANVIITNPTHYSVALRYDERKDRAPKVIAKGTGPTAKQIRTIAISNGIPIYEAPTLARAIYHTTKIGSEVHPALYVAVAIVLSYVHQLKNYQMGLGQLPQRVTNLEIPEEFIFEK